MKAIFKIFFKTLLDKRVTVDNPFYMLRQYYPLRHIVAVGEES